MSKNTQPKQDRFFIDLARHWPIVIAFASIFITWGVFTSRVSSLEAQISVLKVQNDKNTDSVGEVKVSLGEIKTSLEFIKEKLSDGSR